MRQLIFVVRSGDGTIRNARGITPQAKDIIPAVKRTIPLTPGIVPQAKGIVPQAREMMPRACGTNKQAAGTSNSLTKRGRLVLPITKNQIKFTGDITMAKVNNKEVKEQCNRMNDAWVEGAPSVEFNGIKQADFTADMPLPRMTRQSLIWKRSSI